MDVHNLHNSANIIRSSITCVAWLLAARCADKSYTVAHAVVKECAGSIIEHVKEHGWAHSDAATVTASALTRHHAGLLDLLRRAVRAAWCPDKNLATFMSIRLRLQLLGQMLAVAETDFPTNYSGLAVSPPTHWCKVIPKPKHKSRVINLDNTMCSDLLSTQLGAAGQIGIHGVCRVCVCVCVCVRARARAHRLFTIKCHHS